jgi:hypothetical protein
MFLNPSFANNCFFGPSFVLKRERCSASVEVSNDPSVIPLKSFTALVSRIILPITDFANSFAQQVANVYEITI